MQVTWMPRALRQLKRLPASVQQRIVKKVRFFVDQPDPLQFAKALTDPKLGSYRFRVGEYRVIIDVKSNQIIVLKVAKRDEVYD